jgi:cytochrome c-type biogenesis protein CcmH
VSGARRGLSLLAMACAALLTMGAAADDPAVRLASPAQEARARALFQQLRCVVCQNESIDDSEADLASDLRRIVRQKIAEGSSDDQVRAFLVQRYGEFILLKPTLSPGNAALWLAPVLLLAAGGAYLWVQGRKPAAPDDALSDDEERALARLETDGPDIAPPHSGPTNASAADGIKR